MSPEITPSSVWISWIGPVGGIVAITVSLIGAYISIRKIRRESNQRDAEVKKRDAESADIITESALALIKPLKEEVQTLKISLDSTEKELRTLEGEVRLLTWRNQRCKESIQRLVYQLKSHSIVPVCLPDECGEGEVLN